MLWHYWVGHVTHQIVSKMTYNVSIGTLNPTIPYLSVYIQYLYCNLYSDAILQQDLKQHHLTLPEAADLAQNRPLWRMM